MNRKITYRDIMDKYPCYDPAKRGYCTEDWEGTLTDILKHKDIPSDDRIWIVTRFLDDKTNRLFAVWCAREALKLLPDPDPRGVKACDVAEAYAYGQATEEELRAASAAASATVWDAASAAASASARDAAWAARYAARYAASEDAWAARYAARYAASEAAQVKKLIEMIESEV